MYAENTLQKLKMFLPTLLGLYFLWAHSSYPKQMCIKCKIHINGLCLKMLKTNLSPSSWNLKN